MKIITYTAIIFAIFSSNAFADLQQEEPSAISAPLPSEVSKQTDILINHEFIDPSDFGIQVDPKIKLNNMGILF